MKFSRKRNLAKGVRGALISKRGTEINTFTQSLHELICVRNLRDAVQVKLVLWIDITPVQDRDELL